MRSILFVLLASWVSIAQQGIMSLAWDAVDDDRVAGYEVHYGQASGEYGQYQDVVGQTNTTADVDVLEGYRWFFAVLARDADGTEKSGFSNEVFADAGYAIPAAPENLSVVYVGELTMTDFVLEITTTSSPETVVIPTLGGGYSYDIDWDDGNEDLGQTTGNPTHEYASAGTYDVAISGTFPRPYYNNGAYVGTLTDIIQWGDENTWSTNLTGAFYGCSNLTGLPSDDLSIFSSVINGTNVFRDNSLTSLPSGVVLDSLTDGTNMFRGNDLTSLPSGMTLGSLANGNSMFFGNDLTSLPSGVVLDSLTNGRFMFYNNDITSLPSGMVLGSLTDGTNMFRNNTIQTADYSQLLINMEANNSNDGVVFHGGYSKYNSSGLIARTALIDDHSWSFTDGGQAADASLLLHSPQRKLAHILVR